jgi:hypothetical protein
MFRGEFQSGDVCSLIALDAIRDTGLESNSEQAISTPMMKRASTLDVTLAWRFTVKRRGQAHLRQGPLSVRVPPRFAQRDTIASICCHKAHISTHLPAGLRSVGMRMPRRGEGGNYPAWQAGRLSTQSTPTRGCRSSRPLDAPSPVVLETSHALCTCYVGLILWQLFARSA